MTLSESQLAPCWFTHTFDLPEGPLTACTGGQTPRARVTAKVAGYIYRQDINAPQEQFVLIDLSGDGESSGVNPGTLAYRQNDKYGAFTDRVEVRMWFSDKPRLLVRASGPDTSTESGSVSSSVSYSLSGGLFGATGTVNAGWSISSGFAKPIPDFAIEASTIGTGSTAAEHAYALRMVEGAEYNGPPDAVGPSGSGAVRQLPERAILDLPIYSSALFHSLVRIDATRTLHIRLKHRVITVEKTYVGPSYLPSFPTPREGWDEPRVAIKPCALGFMKINSTPTVITREWTFRVDLKSGGVVSNG